MSPRFSPRSPPTDDFTRGHGLLGRVKRLRLNFCGRRSQTMPSPSKLVAGPSGRTMWSRSAPRHQANARWAGGQSKFCDQPVKPMDNSSTRRPQAPRCGARTPTGTPCQRAAIHGRKRCRLHGGLSPGAPRGHRNGNFKTGNWTIEAMQERKWLRSLVRSFAQPMRTE